MSKSAQPLISICIPCFNMDKYVGAAIASAREQDYEQLEIIVIDNASTDHSWPIIQAHMAQDTRVKGVHYSEFVNMPNNWNRALSHAAGEYIISLSADDVLLPHFCRHCLAPFRQRPELAYVFCEKHYLDGADKITECLPFYESSGYIPGLSEAALNFTGSHTAPSQVLIRAACLTAVGGYDERFDWAFDIHLLLKLNLQFDLAYVKEVGVLYRVHDEMSSARFSDTGLGPMEIYRLKSDMLRNLPEQAAHLAECESNMRRNVAKLCLRFAKQALARSEQYLVQRHLFQAQAFFPEISVDIDYCEVWNEASMEPRLPMMPIAPSQSSTQPYPLPQGSQVVHSSGF